MAAILLSFATFISTLGGGYFALRFKEKLHLIMGFAAGVLLGVVAFDIFPEIFNQVRNNSLDPLPVMIALVAAFLLFHVVEKMLVVHHSHEEQYTEHHHPQVGVLSALALAGHSFMDGVGIGLGFQVSHAVGILVALAVISHDFTDGMNTVTLMLSHKNPPDKALRFLLIDALAPVLGASTTLLFTFSSSFLVLYLGFFAGFLLYIGASDILPEAHSKRSSTATIALTVIGAIAIFIISRVV